MFGIREAPKRASIHWVEQTLSTWHLLVELQRLHAHLHKIAGNSMLGRRHTVGLEWPNDLCTAENRICRGEVGTHKTHAVRADCGMWVTAC